MSLLVGLGVGIAIGLAQAALVWFREADSVVITIGTSDGTPAGLRGDRRTRVRQRWCRPTWILSDQVQKQMFIFSPGSLLALGFFVLVGLGLRVEVGAEIRAFGGVPS